LYGYANRRLLEAAATNDVAPVDETHKVFRDLRGRVGGTIPRAAAADRDRAVIRPRRHPPARGREYRAAPRSRDSRCCASSTRSPSPARTSTETRDFEQLAAEKRRSRSADRTRVAIEKGVRAKVREA